MERPAKTNKYKGGFLKFYAIGLLLLLANQSNAAQCGTEILFTKHKTNNNGSPKIGASLRTAAIPLFGRTLVTPHFLIHYSLAGLHKVHTETSDSLLLRKFDSLNTTFKALKQPSRDSLVYLYLDTVNAPQPAYVLKVQQDLESAWNYYIDILGMRAPSSSIRSEQYKVSVNLPHRFPVDLVDIGTVDRDFSGETYAVTYPPPNLSIAFENDFLWATKLTSQGNIVGDSIRSQVNGKVIHNYAREWDVGIKVTAFHEFYHTIQFTYIPKVQSYHAWYEISATGMEERNAPEVNDYIQYLPCVLNNHQRVGLLSTVNGPCTHSPMYGQSIFHQYLSQKLDSTFDVKVWEALANNGDLLNNGLESVFTSYNQKMKNLYLDYSQQLFFSGDQFKPTSQLFSPDMPLWPKLRLDFLDLTNAIRYQGINVPPLTFLAFKVNLNDQTTEKYFLAHGNLQLTQLQAQPNGFTATKLSDSILVYTPPKVAAEEYYLLVTNSSYTENGSVEIKIPESEFYAFPNPIQSEVTSKIGFSIVKNMTFPTVVDVFGENGVKVRTLNFPDLQSPLEWDLKDQNGKLSKPGVYYYRLEKSKLRTLVILK